MLNLLLKLKNIIPFAAILIILSVLAYGGYWRSQYNKSQVVIAQQIKANADIKASNDLLQSAVERWKVAAAQHDKLLKKKEVFVAKQTSDSNDRLNTIMQNQYSPDCGTAVSQGIEKISYLKFNWTNNIP
jgi:hypothetical protein